MRQRWCASALRGRPLSKSFKRDTSLAGTHVEASRIGRLRCACSFLYGFAQHPDVLRLHEVELHIQYRLPPVLSSSAVDQESLPV